MFSNRFCTRDEHRLNQIFIFPSLKTQSDVEAKKLLTLGFNLEVQRFINEIRNQMYQQKS